MFPLEDLEKQLALAQKELSEATASRERAAEIEAQCNMVVVSLRNLAEVQRQRSARKESHIAPVQTPPVVPTASVKSTAATSSTGNAGSHIEWIERVVLATGSTGAHVPKIVRAAERAGVKMHPNYPYTALRTLVEKGRLKKVGLRYYGPNVVPQQSREEGAESDLP